ncbi:MAG: endolytic transglycosylase MltG [Candidatus Shapirobacteria bacterium]|jgi:UPF0755 protein
MIKKIFFLFLSFVVFVVLIFFGFLYLNNQPISSNNSPKVFVIKSGDGIKQISQKLEDSNLIKNKYVFLFYSYKLSLNQKIQAGNFKLSQNLTTKEIVIKLSKGGSTDYWLKIIDGTRVEELDVNADFLVKAKNLEGYLFPDSYLIPQYFTTDQILSTIKNNFDQKFAKAKIDAINIKMTNKEIVIFASIIEREARTLKSKQEIAGILLNRLNIGMALQVDASVQYARDSKKKPVEYWKPLNYTDLSIVSPFNTYKNRGLPPSPICNPGYDSLYAAFHPIDSDYIYYITGNDNKMHYATTLDEHNSNVAKYLR